MNLKILLPFAVFATPTNVARLVVISGEGSLGLLPHRLDCVTALAPGILIYETAEEGESYMALDEGVLVKTGFAVSISVRNAIRGTNLGELNDAVLQEFMNLDEHERNMRAVLEKMESRFISRLTEFHHERPFA